MIAIPISIGIIVIGVIYMQHIYYVQVRANKKLEDAEMYDKFEAQFKDLLKRVDALSLRAGFKL